MMEQFILNVVFFVVGALIGKVLGKASVESFDKWIYNNLFVKNAEDIIITVDKSFTKYEKSESGDSLIVTSGELTEKVIEVVEEA